MGDMMEYCAEHLPRYHPISLSGYHIREAGSTAAQELAFTLAAMVRASRTSGRASGGARLKDGECFEIRKALGGGRRSQSQGDTDETAR